MFEGHVPPDDIERLLEARPNAVGLAGSGMPMGSLGMEYGTRRESFDVTLVGREGANLCLRLPRREGVASMMRRARRLAAFVWPAASPAAWWSRCSISSVCCLM